APRGRSDRALAGTGPHHHPPLRPDRARRKHRAGRNRIVAPPGGIRGRGILDGLPQDQRAVLEARGKHERNELDRGAQPRRRRRRALDQILMAKRAKPAAKRALTPAKSARAAAGELLTLLDFVRYAVSRF